MKIVITGGPGCGKTTVLGVLERMGCTVLSESARKLIMEEQAKGGRALPWDDWQGFQLKVLEMQLRRENELDETVFLDRAAVDGVAYYRLHGTEPPKEFLAACARNGYTIIFLLEQLPSYRTDGQRKEDGETAGRISGLIEQAYAERGYKIVKVPVLPPAERAQYILDKTREVME